MSSLQTGLHFARRAHLRPSTVNHEYASVGRGISGAASLHQSDDRIAHKPIGQGYPYFREHACRATSGAIVPEQHIRISTFSVDVHEVNGLT